MATATQPRNDNSSSVSNTKSMKRAVSNNQLVSKATQFAKDRPWTTATLAGVVGVALLNTLRGR